MMKYDKQLALLFGLLTALFIILAMTNTAFMTWVFQRHQNEWSWYVRPLFLIPFCYFAYRQTWFGISFTLFCIFTSMCWFSAPAVVSEEVKTFLVFEQEWLQGAWDIKKVILILTVPLSFTLLGIAFWKRSMWMGLAVLIMMATGKIIWSISNAGASGASILAPAILGLLICTGLIYFGFKHLERKVNR